MSLICCQVLIPIHQPIPLLKRSLMLSGIQEVSSTGCLLHLLCESAASNIQMQKTGAGVIFHAQEALPASDLERWMDREGG
jgi:hypothetical protein